VPPAPRTNPFPDCFPFDGRFMKRSCLCDDIKIKSRSLTLSVYFV